ncbi:hypothetical protein Tco_1303229 [Tanacetum coccineum]
MAPMALSDSKVNNDKSCSKTCLTNYEALKKQYDDLLVKLDDTGFKAATYKRGLATLEDQIVKYREHEVLFSEEIALLKRSVGHKEYQMGLLRAELEKITDKSKKGVGYHVVPSPHPLILNRPTTLDLSYSGLEEFKEPEVIEYGPRDSSLKSTTGCDKKSENSKKNTDDSLEQHQMTDTQTSSFESPLKVDKDWKEKFFYPANHVESAKIEKPVRKNNDAPIIEDWVLDDKDEVETTVVVKKKTVIPSAAKIEKPVRKHVRYAKNVQRLKDLGNPKDTGMGRKIDMINEDHFCSDGCTNSGEARVHQRKRRIQRRVHQKQKDQEDEVFGRILSAKKMKITAVGEKVNAAESLLVVSTEVNAN